MKWKCINVDPTDICNQYGLKPLTGKLISASNLSQEQISEILDSDNTLITSKASCVLQACQRILQARENKEKVFVAGDYDADGVCSTAIMKATLDCLGITNGYYIPNRVKEGYGLKPSTVELASEKGYSLIITVDNGVKAHEALQKAKQLQLETIVTDHHTIEEDVDCNILVHPNFLEEPFQYLSGAGVALQISRNLIGNKDVLNALAGVAAIGDVMPMWRQTRKLVLKTIDLLKQNTPMSLTALANSNYIDQTAISFGIVPKLNSLGRMSDLCNVNTLPQYLLSSNVQDIKKYALQVNQINEMRKKRSEREFSIAEELIQSNDAIHVLYSDSFHEGICGMTASKVSDKYHKPSIVLARSGNLLKGSGRSVTGLDLFTFCKDFPYLSAFGGHVQAVGLSFEAQYLEAFQQYVKEKATSIQLKQEEEEQSVLEIQENDINLENLMDLQRLDPYPQDMFKPYFMIQNPQILEMKETAKMVKYTIYNAYGGFDAVCYKRKNIKVVQQPKLMIGTVSINRWLGKIRCQFVIEDMQS